MVTGSNNSTSTKDDILSHATFADEDIIVFDNIRDITLSKRVKLENFIIALCTKGHGMITVNGTTCNVGPSDLIICRPNHILEHMMQSMDFECACLCVSPEYMQNIVLMANSWDIKVVIEQNPVIHLNEEESQIIRYYSILFKATISGKPLRHHKEVLEALMRASTCYFTDVFSQHIEIRPHNFYKSEVEFNRFFDLLSSTYPRERKVEYYAEKLNISNRHLAAICMRVSGKTALHLITEYAVKDIKRELLKPENTIKQVALKLGFDNVSCMGRYFRNFTGVSPKQFRTLYIKKMYEGAEAQSGSDTAEGAPDEAGENTEA